MVTLNKSSLNVSGEGVHSLKEKFFNQVIGYSVSVMLYSNTEDFLSS